MMSSAVHAYLILAHDLPERLERLIASLRTPGAAFCVHIDAKSDIAPFLERIGTQPDVHFIDNREEVCWGGFSQVQATLNSIRAALAAAPSAKRLTLLSGACYPIADNASLTDLCDRPGIFMNMRLISPDDEGYQRIARYYLIDHPLLNPRNPREIVAQHRSLYRYISGLLERLPDQRPLGMDYYKGSQWWSMPRDAVEYCLHFIESRPDFVEVFRYSWIPDEAFFHTIIGNSDYMSRVKPRLHYINWSRESIRNKKILAIDALPRILESGRLFVRKVHPETSAELLDALDHHRGAA